MVKKLKYDWKKTAIKIIKIGVPYFASFLIALSTEMPELSILGAVAHIYLDYNKHK